MLVWQEAQPPLDPFPWPFEKGLEVRRILLISRHRASSWQQHTHPPFILLFKNENSKRLSRFGTIPSTHISLNSQTGAEFSGPPSGKTKWGWDGVKATQNRVKGNLETKWHDALTRNSNREMQMISTSPPFTPVLQHLTIIIPQASSTLLFLSAKE